MVTNGSIEIRVLGPLEAVEGSRSIPLGGTKQRSVLALLALARGAPVSAQRLIDEIWDGRPPESAHKSVQVYVSALRKALGEGRIVTHERGYALRIEPHELDLERFEGLAASASGAGASEAAATLKKALGLFRARPLADLTLEPWAQRAADQIDEERADALERRIEADLELGRHRDLCAELEQLVAEHPYREHFRAQLMLALFRSGRQAQALEAYRRGEAAMSSELGLRPSRELQDLEQRLLRQDPSLDLAPLGEDGVTAPPDRAVETTRIEGATPASPRRRLRAVLAVSPSKRRYLIIGVAALVLAAAAAAVMLSRGGGATVVVRPNSLAVIDPEHDKLVAAIPVGVRPGPVVAGAGSVWVGNASDQTLSRVDPGTRAVRQTIPLDSPPDAVAVASGLVWVAYGKPFRLAKLAPGEAQASVATTYHSTCPPGCPRETRFYLRNTDSWIDGRGIAVGGGSLWTVGVINPQSILIRTDPSGGRLIATTELAADGVSGIAEGNGAVWISAFGDNAVWKVSERTAGVADKITVGHGPSDVAFGNGSVWVATSFDNSVSRIDVPEGEVATVKSVIPVGKAPVAVAVDEEAVWVANSGDGTISRIDPRADKVVATIRIGNAPTAITAAYGRVWVTVRASGA